MALDGIGADRMLNAALRAGRVLMTAQVLRFFPEYTALRQAIAGERLGRVRFAMFRRRCSAPLWSKWLHESERSGGGVFDLLIHDVDMSLHLFGKPRTVAACGVCEPASGVDYISAQLFYEYGAVVEIHGGWHAPGEYPFSMEYSVALDGGTVEYSSMGRPPTLYPRNAPTEVLTLEAADAYAAEIGYFAECCRRNSPPAHCPPAESAASVKLMLLLLESRSSAR